MIASSWAGRPSSAPAGSLVPTVAGSQCQFHAPRFFGLASGSCDRCGHIVLESRVGSSSHRWLAARAGAGSQVAHSLVREEEGEVLAGLARKPGKDEENSDVQAAEAGAGREERLDYRKVSKWRWIRASSSASSASWEATTSTPADSVQFLRDLQAERNASQSSGGSDSKDFLYVDDDLGAEAASPDSRDSDGEAEAVPADYRPLPINLDLKLYKAYCLRRKGKYFEAEAILRQCTKEWPSDGRAFVSLAKTLILQRKMQEARTVFENGCQAASGENAYIWQGWACLECKLGRTARARQLFDAATTADKRHAAAWHGWAVLELREGNKNKALSLLNRGLRLCRPNEYLYQTLALIYFNDKDYDAARANFVKATQVNAKSAASWVAWATMEGKLGSSTARRLFQKGLEASPKNRYVWQAWAIFEADQGNRDRARELFKRGSELNPRDPVLLQAFALFEYKCCNDSKASTELFQQGVTVDPKHQPLWVAWGWMEAKEDNIDKARELYKRAILVDSKSMDAVRAYQAWGVMEERQGNFGVARELFKCALKVDPQNSPTWMSWAAMEERQENFVRADELRNLCLQQRVEVVEGVSWDVDNITDLLAPALDKLKGLLSLDWTGNQDGEGTIDDTLEAVSLEAPSTIEFDIDEFLKKTFPWRYGAEGADNKSSGSPSAARQPGK